MLQRRFAVKLQECFVDYETSPDFNFWVNVSFNVAAGPDCTISQTGYILSVELVGVSSYTSAHHIMHLTC